jgi:hypothetical protein
VVAVIGGDIEFTTYWLRRFVKCIVVGSTTIVISFFGTALLVRNAGPHVRRAVPRLIAALTCLLYLAALSWLTYIQHNPGSYIEIGGRQIHPAIHAAWWAMGPAVVLVCVVVGVETASCLMTVLNRTSPIRKRVEC